jgi:serine/threonine-protein kinase
MMRDGGHETLAGGRYREFEILELVGEGSFARVYRVRAPGHKEPLALKLASNAKMSPDAIKRAVREVAILRTLGNPHVVRLHGSSIGADHFYLLMDYLEGKQLDRFHNFDLPMDPELAVGIMQQVCMGLAEAHAKGVVHRDLKPANIWLEPDGTAKILDFGLARAWGVPWAFGANATAARTLVGTPHYCQPEQLGSPELSPASDVYSLATILYELLSGHPVLFPNRRVTEVVDELRDNPIQWLDAHVNKPVAPITQYPECAQLPESILAILEASLAKDPGFRPQDAGKLGSALGNILYKDFGAVEPARIRLRSEALGEQDRLLIPGRRFLGSAIDADLRVQAEGLQPQHVILDWSGSPRPVQLRPAGDASVLLEGKPVTGPVYVEAGQRYTAGPLTLEILYP